MAKHHEDTKRTLGDSVRLWGTACFVIGLGVSFFWLSDELHLQGKWRLYWLLNLAFSVIVIWRFRAWFKHIGDGLVLIAWLTVHFIVYGLLTHLNLNLFLCIFLFPVEAMILVAVGQVLRAKHREQE